ncbi:hypothetical protein [Ancylomarina sp.]|uniref:hypothetical protein n=1 Tax=Ancylomarina sp. TaxID=1970196 RepID=UPI003564462E
MNDKQIIKLIGIFYGLSTLLVLMGAFFRLQHYPNGLAILVIGFMIGTATSSFDTFRLKKKIKKLEEQIKQTD